MKCLSCTDHDLKPVLTDQGVVVDYCSECGGIWLDKGEIFFFTQKPEVLQKELEAAIQNAGPTDRACPGTGEAMESLKLFNGTLTVDYCRSSGGIWLDSGEARRLSEGFDKGFNIRFDKKTASDTAASPSRPRTAVLPALPNLFVRSVTVMLFLYGFVFLVLIAVTIFTELPPGFAVITGVILVTFQFITGPFITDLSLKWFYSLTWVPYSALPDHLSSFIRKTCDDNDMRYPKMGIISDGAPNAFTYGHTPNNARIVLTRGLLDLLTEKEVEAVAAHEIGHAKHWDILLMTAAQLAPLILYYIYRTLIRMRSRGKDKSAAPRIAVAITAYILYIISEYLVLWLSRTREYYADRFAGETTNDPDSLVKGLIKIGYGLAGRESKKKKEGKGDRKAGFDAVGALGIFDAKAGTAMAVASLPSVSAAKKMGDEIDRDNLKGAMRWDLWNPWAKFYELNSTHPLIANRILGMQSEIMGREPYIRFDETRPESYWDEFFLDIVVMFLPAFSFILFLIMNYIYSNPKFIGVGVMAMGIASIAKTSFSYSLGFFPDMSVSGLLKKVKVSAVRPVPCRIKGTVVGRGVPGLIWSEDFVMQDETGIIFLDYSQPIPLWNFFFGLMGREKYDGREVEVTGWYRRMPVPYLEIRSIKMKTGSEQLCYTYKAKYIWGALLAIIGLTVALYI
jgi:heat shock protein HtpX